MQPLDFDRLPSTATLTAGVRERGVVVIRGLRLELPGHLALMAAFGPIQGPLHPDVRPYPLVQTLDESTRSDHAWVRRVFDEQFHADLSWYPDGIAITSLWADIADVGAPATSFIDTRAAVDRLTAELRSAVRDRRAHHHTRRSRELRHPEALAARAAARPPGAVERVRGKLDRRRLRAAGVPIRSTPVVPPPGHAIPVVDRDPRSGHELVRLGDHAWTIEGMADDEGLALVDRCNEAITADGPDYVHQWLAGDLVIFDNLLVLHRREPTPTPGVRRLRRIVALAAD